MTQVIVSPPSQTILDEEKRTLSGTISEGVTVIVPSGLYYASGSIILRHPEAQLILESGVQIMFAEHASIRVDFGTFKVLGSTEMPVQLTPTMNLTFEYGDSAIPNSTVFDGIYFGPNCNGTTAGDGNQYISGSILQGLDINFGGYDQASASIYLDGVSVMLKNVNVRGDWSRNVHGIYIYNPEDSVLLDGVSIENAGGEGIFISYASSQITIMNVEVHGCRSYGIRIMYSESSIISRSHIHHNGEDQVYVSDYSGEMNPIKG